MFKMKMKGQSGFTLVELMVVVAIIGILSAIAIPQFQTYQAKSRTSEAKLALAGIYSAEVAFQGETGNYAACLEDMGYRPSASADQRYYTVGFSALGTVPTAVTSITECNSGFVFLGTKMGNDAVAIDLTNSVAASSTAFTAEARGTVDSAAANLKADRWTINQDKLTRHLAIGY